MELAAFGPLRFKAVVIVDNTLPPTNLTYLSFEGRITNVVKCRLWPSNMTFTCGVEVSNGKVYNKNINPNGSMDVVQGGTFNTQGIIKDEFHPQLQQAGLKDIQWRRYNPNHSFIPTVSALAFKNPNFDWNSDISRNLLCGQEIPFDSYFVPQENEEHIKITSEMVSWLTKEIKGQAQKPNLNLAHITPNSTKKVVCKDETFYVSIDETNQCNMPSNYSWSTSEGLQIVGNNNSAKIQVKALKDGLGYVYANFSNGQKVPIKIWIGKPQVHYETEPMGYKINYLLKSSVSDANLEDQGIIKYNCDNTKFTGNGYISSDCVQGSMRVHRSMDTNWSVYRNTIVTNSCGTSNTVLDYALPHPPCDEYNFVLSDNNTYKLIQPCFPNILSIEKKLERINDNLNIHIIDFVGNIVINTPNKEFSLSHLLPGTYYARVIKNGEIVYTQTLLKK